MEILTPVVAGVLLTVFTGIQVWINKGRFDILDRRMDGLERRMDAMERRIEQLAGEFAQLRSDLLQVALAANPRPRPVS